MNMISDGDASDSFEWDKRIKDLSTKLRATELQIEANERQITIMRNCGNCIHEGEYEEDFCERCHDAGYTEWELGV